MAKDTAWSNSQLLHLRLSDTKYESIILYQCRINTVICAGTHYLHGNRKFRLENQMVPAIPFGKLQKIWAVIWGDAIFLLFLVCSADLDCSGSFSHHVKFSSLMFMKKISTRVVCLNGKHPCRAAFSVNSRIFVNNMITFHCRRLDYFVVSERLVPKLSDSLIRQRVKGSDHCPVVLLLAF